MNQTAFLQSERVNLRPVEQADLPVLYQWVNDPELRGLIGETRPASQAGMETYLKRIEEDSHRVWLMIVERATQQVVGEAGLLRMFPDWRTTDLSMIIGDKAARGKGYGSEAMQLLLDYAFGYLNFHRVAIGVVGSNTRALRFYEKAGFKREGIQRDGYFYNHQYQDFVMMSILEHEYREQLAADKQSRK